MKMGDLSWQMESVAGTSWTICINAPVSSWPVTQHIWKFDFGNNTTYEHLISVIQFANCLFRCQFGIYTFSSSPIWTGNIQTSDMSVQTGRQHLICDKRTQTSRTQFAVCAAGLLSDFVFVVCISGTWGYFVVFIAPGGRPGFEGSQLWNQDEPLHLLLSPCCKNIDSLWLIGQLKTFWSKLHISSTSKKKSCKTPTWIWRGSRHQSQRRSCLHWDLLSPNTLGGRGKLLFWNWSCLTPKIPLEEGTLLWLSFYKV